MAKSKLRSILTSGVNLIVARKWFIAACLGGAIIGAALCFVIPGCGPKIVLPEPVPMADRAGVDNAVPPINMTDAERAEWFKKHPPTPKPEKPNDTPQTAINDLSRILGWVAGICTLLSAIACVASIFIPVIPRRGAILALAVSIGIGLVRVVVIAYGLVTAHVAFWASVAALIVAAITVAWPMALAWRNALLLRTSKKLESQGDARAAVALKVEAAPSMLPSKQDRKDAVVEIDMKGRP